jgi:hypothetical protein
LHAVDIGHACAHVVIVVGVLEIPQARSSLLVIDLLYVTILGLGIIRKYINAFEEVQLYNIILFLFFIPGSLRPGSRFVVCVVSMRHPFTGTHGVIVVFGNKKVMELFNHSFAFFAMLFLLFHYFKESAVYHAFSLL